MKDHWKFTWRSDTCGRNLNLLIALAIVPFVFHWYTPEMSPHLLFDVWIIGVNCGAYLTKLLKDE